MSWHLTYSFDYCGHLLWHYWGLPCSCHFPCGRVSQNTIPEHLNLNHVKILCKTNCERVWLGRHGLLSLWKLLEASEEAPSMRWGFLLLTPSPGLLVGLLCPPAGCPDMDHPPRDCPASQTQAAKNHLQGPCPRLFFAGHALSVDICSSHQHLSVTGSSSPEPLAAHRLIPCCLRSTNP